MGAGNSNNRKVNSNFRYPVIQIYVNGSEFFQNDRRIVLTLSSEGRETYLIRHEMNENDIDALRQLNEIFKQNGLDIPISKELH